MKKTNERAIKFFYQVILILIAAAFPAFAHWNEEGPGPILKGNNVQLPDRPQAGAISSIVPHPTRSNIIYVGTVNGGVWVTKNAYDENPKWKQLTDLKLPGLSISSLAMSPFNSKTLYAGTGSESSLFFLGDPGFGVAKTTDGGKTWKVLARKTFLRKKIVDVIATTLKKGKVILAASPDDEGGVYRSIDEGVTFERISGKLGSNLPSQGVSSLVADPSHSKRLYAAVPVPSSGNATGNEGVYRSDDGGKHWTLITLGLTNFSQSMRMLLAAHGNKTLQTQALYLMIINSNGMLANVFRSVNQGEFWNSMGVPNPPIFPGGQGDIHGALYADSENPNIVFIAGDRQEGPFPNVNGCTSFCANVFRGDASLLPANPWQNIVGSGANGTAPHPDSRWMVFDAKGNLLQANDGGIYRLNQPNNEENRIWTSVLGNIRPCEIHSAAFDSVSKIVFGGSQDNGTPIQQDTDEFLANDFTGADGGIVAVDTDQTAHPGTSIRYTCVPFLRRFNKTSFNASNNVVAGPTLLPLLILNGPNAGKPLVPPPPAETDLNIQFYNPYVLNALDPTRMLIGTANIYESFDQGNTLTDLGFQGQFISCLAYGGRLNGVNRPDVFYAGTKPTSLPSKILMRENIGDPIVTLSNYPGAAVISISMDPNNFQQIYVADSLGQVWSSPNAGFTWSNLTFNLQKLTSNTLEVVLAYPQNDKTKVAVGGLGGVFVLKHGSEWTALNRKLPHGLVFDLRYDSTDNLLVAGILGRGIWILRLSDNDDSSSSSSSKSGNHCTARKCQVPKFKRCFRIRPLK